MAGKAVVDENFAMRMEYVSDIIRNSIKIALTFSQDRIGMQAGPP